VAEDVYEKMDKELLSYVEDVLLNRCSNATERLLAFADSIEPKCKPCAVRKKGVAAGAVAGDGVSTWRDLPVGKRIEHALVKGLDTYIVEVCDRGSHVCTWTRCTCSDSSLMSHQAGAACFAHMLTS
jgi:cobalamin-dependent methionine synthase I